VRAFFALTCACLCLAAGPQPAQRDTQLPFSAADADRFAVKLAGMLARTPATGPRSRKPVQTIVTEPEVNAYLCYRAQSQIPVGVLDPVIVALEDGRLIGRATVDLDLVRLSRERGWLDPMQLLRGRVPVEATGVLRSRNGTFQFELESAYAGGVLIPKSLLQELVSFYSRTTANPAGIDMDAPFELPAGIREITVKAARAIIVQ
jgi:hypothetical protein